MEAQSRNTLLEIAAEKFVSASYRNEVYGRENSTELEQSRGYLNGVCTAFEVDYEFVRRGKDILAVQFFHQKSGKMFLQVKTDDNMG